MMVNIWGNREVPSGFRHPESLPKAEARLFSITVLDLDTSILH